MHGNEHRHKHFRLELIERDRSFDWCGEILAAVFAVFIAPLSLFLIGALL